MLAAVVVVWKMELVVLQEMVAVVTEVTIMLVLLELLEQIVSEVVAEVVATQVPVVATALMVVMALLY
jgi:hypothetical protein